MNTLSNTYRLSSTNFNNVVGYFFLVTRRNNHNRKIFKVLGSKSGSGSTISKCGSEDPDPDPLLQKGGSEDPDPDSLFPNVDRRIRIRIHVKMRWIRNAASNNPCQPFAQEIWTSD